MSQHSSTFNGNYRPIQDAHNLPSIKIAIPPGSGLDGEKQEEENSLCKTLREVLESAGTEQPLLLIPWLIQVGLVGLTGSSDTGKSCFARQLCLSIINGESEFLGFPLNPQHKQAIYVTTEDDETSTGAAFKRLLQASHTENQDALRFVLETDDLVTKLDKLLKMQPADIVVIDAYLDILEGNSSEAHVTRNLLRQYKRLADRHKTLIFFVHHTAKGKAKEGPNKHNALGSQAWEAKCRAVLELRTDDRDPLLKHLCIVKGNFISSEHKKESFHLDFDESTLSFTNTGSRTLFGDLAAAPAEGKGKVAFRPEDFPDEQHHEWLEEVFTGNPLLKYQDLTAKLKEVCNCGTNKVTGGGGLIPYYISKNFLRKVKLGYEYTPPTPF